jgi:hypothetical protein
MQELKLILLTMKKLTELHEKVKNHPFRLNHSDWKGYHQLIQELYNEFKEELKIKFQGNYDNHYWYFLHEFSSAIWHFKFEFIEGETYEGDCGRIGLKSEENIKDGYGVISEEDRKIVVLALESYIQQIHHFIDSKGNFEEFITYYFGCNTSEDGIRWNKYKLNHETNYFDWVGKIK